MIRSGCCYSGVYVVMVGSGSYISYSSSVIHLPAILAQANMAGGVNANSRPPATTLAEFARSCLMGLPPSLKQISTIPAQWVGGAAPSHPLLLTQLRALGRCEGDVYHLPDGSDIDASS